MNAASRLALHIALAVAAGYAGAHYRLHDQPVAAPLAAAGMLVRTSTASAGPPPHGGAARNTARVIGASDRGAAARATASVVTVYCATGGAAGGNRTALELAIASGVVLDRDGLVVTTSVVAAQSGNVIVGLPDGTQRPARLLGADAGAGLALLKVDGPALEPIETAGPDAAAVGDTVLAVGDALGLGPTVTKGIISAIRAAELAGAAPVDFIQTDASIHPGNFGGALVDAAGRLVGITVGTVGVDGAESLAFAVPVERVARVMTQLRRAAHAQPSRPPVTPERGRFTQVSYPGRSAATE
jgi:S1-C subfamily serine protease